ncbi:hypothetical protein HOS33_gp157 [Erwinia phage vB_EamM_Y3]|uniref:Uncharacterized protein n=1 Tax=Erwinia phage vB_EamM_Y3 TaxID=1983553 RepID=A0A2H4IB65_9CAUD|nr:hypothetical protein HOS33_gp157 [Erwinia phage vB_EamM_Y3]ARW58797.1 hypothetical protein Y3_157 [Erwinia phage vB_EamM_Y3]QZE56020.1 hypothetical protein pEaSNUABM52_00162 [Erwinia phage pEp_SNUABM_52]
MFTLAIQGNLEYCFSQRNKNLRFVVHLDSPPLRGTLQIENSSGKVLKTVAMPTTGTVADFDFTVPFDTGEHDIVAKAYNVSTTLNATSNRVRVSVPFSGEYGPRFGVLDKVMSLIDYNDAFFRALPTILGEESPQLITCPPNESTSDNNRFFYVAWPKRLLYGYFQETAQGFSGSWDGAMEFNDFNFEGAAEVSLGGFDYVVYRNDFPFDSLDYVFRIKYGSTSPKSGDPV